VRDEGEDRWPPVYDLDDLVAEIKRLTEHRDIATAFYEWRRDRSIEQPSDVCQGDLISLASDVPVIHRDGQPATVDHPDHHWLVVGNTCDFDRKVEDVPWTQLVPVISLGAATDLTATQIAAARKYTQSRSFFVPPWNADVEQDVYVADLLRPVGVDKRALQGAEATGVVHARISRAAWILLNACLVRFLARDDGRYA
jgi:hypothetical protein